MLKITNTREVLQMSLRGYMLSIRAYNTAMRVAEAYGIKELKDTKDFFDLFYRVSEFKTDYKILVELALFGGLLEAFELKILNKDFVLSSAYVNYNTLFFGNPSPRAQYFSAHTRDAQLFFDEEGEKINLK